MSIQSLPLFNALLRQPDLPPYPIPGQESPVLREDIDLDGDDEVGI